MEDRIKDGFDGLGVSLNKGLNDGLSDSLSDSINVENIGTINTNSGLSVVNTGGSLATIIDSNGMDNLMKPFIKEIHLFDTYVAGTSYLVDKSVLEDIKKNDSLVLRREDNKFDSNAVIIFNDQNKKLGYIPEKDNIIFARLMDAGKILKAKIIEIENRGNFTKIKIGIYLLDI